MNTANFPKSKESSQSAESKSLKLVIFSVGTLYVALHIDSVQKVINYSTIFSSGLNHFGLVNIGDQEITVIDLHKKLFYTPQIENLSTKKYLILAKNTRNELFGIIINETPTLLDILLSDIRILPPSYRQADTLAIASHVTVIPQEKEELTVFILDPDELLKPLE